MKCGICGRELDENGHCLPCEQRAEYNNLRTMTLEEQLNYQGETIDENGSADNDNWEQPRMKYKVYRTDNTFTGRLVFYLILVALLLFLFFVILPVAAAGALVAVIAGGLIGLWHYLIR